MKLNVIYMLFVSLVLLFFITSFSGGPAGTRGEDRTGSPFSKGGVPCTVCHNNGSFNPGMDVELFDGEELVNHYEPGKTYRIKYAIVATSGIPQGFGFQSVILSTSENENVGQFTDPGEGMRIADIEGRKYVEHTTPNMDNTFEVEWTAPETGTGNVTIYTAGIASNLNGSNGGDNGATATLELTEGLTSAIAEIPSIESLNIHPNPVVDFLNMEIHAKESQFFQFMLFDLNGKVIHRQSLPLIAGQNLQSINLGFLSAGLYVLRLSDGKGSFSRRVLKK